ncbi:MAG TPA: LLM class flavin-dependent oxidoreductase [Tepidiformaceae bacterium]|nr:LLM class flavin-dependent oxidoreductase [Tepidiformaceae bacterium]
MAAILTCTWAPTPLSGPHLLASRRPGGGASGEATASAGDVRAALVEPVLRAEALGIDYLLVAQRWYGTGKEIEGSTYDCLAMTAYYAACTERIRLVTAIHPGFFLPAPIAKWGATLDCITGGRWAINVTSGWHLQEFPMYGAEVVEHDARYERSKEFIDVLRGAWRGAWRGAGTGDGFNYSGVFYQVEGLELEPRPQSPMVEVFQGGQSEAAREMAASHSDWVFLNGGRPEKVAEIVSDVRARAAARGRTVRFALYGIPLCRESDEEADGVIAAMAAAVDPEIARQRRSRVSGAQGMWAESDDVLTKLDSNEGFASRLIGSPDTIHRRMMEFHELGIDMFHLTLNDELFVSEVLPRIQAHR